MKSGLKFATFESDLILFLMCCLYKFAMELTHSTRCNSGDSFLIDQCKGEQNPMISEAHDLVLTS